VRQVGYLQRLYRDAQSTEHTIFSLDTISNQCKHATLSTV